MSAQCAYCEGRGTRVCEACARPVCYRHVPYGGHGFCESCLVEWKSGEVRRTALLAVVAVAALIPALFAARYLAYGMTSLIWVLMAPPLLAARATSWVMRRRFRPRGNVPHATARV